MSGDNSSQETEVQFQFVNSTVDNALVPPDVATRVLIRKQAMKKASTARKRNGSYGKHNLRQYPIFIQSDVQRPAPNREPILGGKTSEERSIKKDDHPRTTGGVVVPKQIRGEPSPARDLAGKSPAPVGSEISLARRIPTSLPRTTFEFMTKYGISILDLSNLTTFHVCRATRKLLSSDPSQVINLLRYNQWSFFSYLLSSYEQSPCVKYAADCVVARVRQILSSTEDGWDAVVISQYVKALNALQKALDCPEQQFSPDVLYATEILALYELLAPSDPSNWIRHSAGAAHLIRIRGPKRYNTDFEKSLFMAHVGAISTECMLNNERCFLEDDAWKDVFESVIMEDSVISDRSEIVISLLIHKSKVAGICCDATSIICNDTTPNLTTVDKLRCRASQLRSNLLKWRLDHKELLGTTSEICCGSIEDDKRCKVIGVYLSCLIITNRVLAAITPQERLSLEDETQSLVSQVFCLQKRVNELRPEAALFLAQTVLVAKATLDTAPLWRGPVDVHGQSQMIERWRFEKYCKLMGRKVT